MRKRVIAMIFTSIFITGSLCSCKIPKSDFDNITSDDMKTFIVTEEGWPSDSYIHTYIITDTEYNIDYIVFRTSNGLTCIERVK